MTWMECDLGISSTMTHTLHRSGAVMVCYEKGKLIYVMGGRNNSTTNSFPALDVLDLSKYSEYTKYNNI